MLSSPTPNTLLEFLPTFKMGSTFFTQLCPFQFHYIFKCSIEKYFLPSCCQRGAFIHFKLLTILFNLYYSFTQFLNVIFNNFSTAKTRKIKSNKNKLKLSQYSLNRCPSDSLNHKTFIIHKIKNLAVFSSRSLITSSKPFKRGQFFIRRSYQKEQRKILWIWLQNFEKNGIFEEKSTKNALPFKQQELRGGENDQKWWQLKNTDGQVGLKFLLPIEFQGYKTKRKKDLRASGWFGLIEQNERECFWYQVPEKMEVNNNIVNISENQNQLMYSNVFPCSYVQESNQGYFPIVFFNNCPSTFGFYNQSFEPSESNSKEVYDKKAQIDTYPIILPQFKKLQVQKHDSSQHQNFSKSSTPPKQKTKSTYLKAQSKKDQNSMRNILPNIVHQLVIFVQKKSKSKTIVERILKSYGKQDKRYVEKFYLYQRFIKEKTSHYLNEDILKEYTKVQEIKCQLFSLEEQKQFLKISRILVRYFIKSFIRNSILTSTRMKPQIKDGHLSLLRYLEERVNEIYSQ